MNSLAHPGTKLLLALAAMMVFAVVALAPTLSGPGLARLTLIALSLGGLGWWVMRGRSKARFELEPRLAVIQRVGLSQRTGAALVEVDGRAYLIVHGDGFAEIRRAPRARPVLAERRAMSRFFSVCALLGAFDAAAKAPVELQSTPMASNEVQLMGVLALLSLAPFAIMMLTSFSKVVVVLGFVRSALGTQQAPPTMVLTGLAAVLSATIMTPTVEKMWSVGRQTSLELRGGAQLLDDAQRIAGPLREFLVKHGAAEERARFVDLAHELRGAEEGPTISEDDLSIVVPAFVITELKEAFIMGFLVFLPFLVLDMLVANVLLALGMQTLSPTQVSLPFKLLLFIAVDGWALLARGLILAYR